MAKKKTNEEYLEYLDKYNSTVFPLEEYQGRDVAILHQCKKCGNKIKRTPTKVKDYILRNLNLCQKCSGVKLYVGKNDLWTTDPEVAAMLKNPEDGYKVTRGSYKKLDWICPDCGAEIKQKSVANTVKHRLVCSLCSNTRSLGHRLVNSVLSELNIEFINEKSFYWGNGKSYDIYIDDYNCIIEINGVQHYEEAFFHHLKGATLQDEIDNDVYKKDLALSNGIKYYIFIDARESSVEYIVEGIKNNKEFNDLFDMSKINWNNVVNNALTSDIIKIRDLYNQNKSVPEICKVVHMSDTVVQRHLNTLTSFGLCDYKGVEEVYKPVICLNTREEFASLQEAGDAYNIDPNGISFVCRGLRNRHTAGKLNDGTKLTWLFKEDYETKTESEIQEIIHKSIHKPIGAKKVVCLNTKEVFDKIKDAQEKYQTAKSISDCCRHIARSSGTLPNTNERLKWVYYDEYATLSNDEIENILRDNDYDDKRVICLNTHEVFENATVAAKWCGVERSGICNCCIGKTITNGKHPETGEPLMWAHYRKYKLEVG